MSNEILVAGMHMPDNQFTRFVNGYGFQVIHRPDSEANREVPIVHGALICTSQISHSLRNKVIDTYKSRGLPWLETRSDSTSAIKEQFEKLMIDPIKKDIEPLDIKDRIIYLILFFNKVNSKIHSTSWSQVMLHYTHFSGAYASVIIAKLAEMGILEKLTGTGSQGMWRVKGLTRSQRDQLITKLGRSVPESWLINEPVVKEAPKPEPLPEKQLVEEQTKGFSHDFEKEMRDSMQAFHQKIGTQISQMQSQINRLSHSFNPTSRKDMNNQLIERLDELSLDEYLKVHAAIIMLTK